MLTGKKHVALVNNYSIDPAETCKKLEKLAALDLFEHCSKLQHDFKVPYMNLKIYLFDNGDTSAFESPNHDQDKLLRLDPIYFLNYAYSI